MVQHDSKNAISVSQIKPTRVTTRSKIKFSHLITPFGLFSLISFELFCFFILCVCLAKLNNTRGLYYRNLYNYNTVGANVLQSRDPRCQVCHSKV